MQIKIAYIPEGFYWEKADHENLLQEGTSVVVTSDRNEHHERVPMFVVYCDWPLLPRTRAFFQRVCRYYKFSKLEELEVTVLKGPKAGNWFDLPVPQDPGGLEGVWYTSRRLPAQKSKFQPIEVQGQWFGETFYAIKKDQYNGGNLNFRGREYLAHSGARDNMIPGLTEEQTDRIAFVRGVLAILAGFTDGCWAGEKPAIQKELEEALRS